MFEIEFEKDGELQKIQDTTRTGLYIKLLDFLYNSGYEFEGPLHTPFVKKILTKYEVDFAQTNNPSVYGSRNSSTRFHKLDKNKYFYLYRNKDVENFWRDMIIKFGADPSSIVIKNGADSEKDNDVKKFSDFKSDDASYESVDNLNTLSKAAQIVLNKNGNVPMTASEIWNEIQSMNLYKTRSKTPINSLQTGMLYLSSNSNITRKSKTEDYIFKIVSESPQKFVLLNPEVSNREKDTEDTIKNTEIESPLVYKNNPFKQAICVLGDSGSGKSTTVENILESAGHKYEFIIPSSSTTGLLSQFSPSGKYILSTLGEMLIDSSENPNDLYTAIFDECHKSAFIEMINDELLQAISLKRNRFRFITLDTEIRSLYNDSKLEKSAGRIKIPDNFGFIFISSKPDVIRSNDDFFRRVDIVKLKKWEEEKIDTIEELLSKKISEEEKSQMEYKRGED